jgi:hypothetical protein
MFETAMKLPSVILFTKAFHVSGPASSSTDDYCRMRMR